MFCLTRRQFVWLCENAVAARRDYVPPFSAVYFDSETGMLKRRFMDGTETPEIDPPHCEPPQLMVVAGPNGSGKSTISAGLPIPRSLANLPALAEIADLLRVVDNSGDAPELIYEVSDAGRQIFENQHWSNSEILNFVG